MVASTRQKFTTVLDHFGRPGGEVASFTLPFDAKSVWGKVRVPVKGTINGFAFRSTVAAMHGKQLICVNATMRAGAKVRAGDRVTVTLEPDTDPRTIEIPLELKRALGPKLASTLEKLAYTHKKEFVLWYTEAKKDETRARRVEKMRAMLASGKIDT